jgi:hypothetical protein
VTTALGHITRARKIPLRQQAITVEMPATVKWILTVMAMLMLRMSHRSSMTLAEISSSDVNCDANVDATDVTKFLEDFGRNTFNNPCPACTEGKWCSY